LPCLFILPRGDLSRGPSTRGGPGRRHLSDRRRREALVVVRRVQHAALGQREDLPARAALSRKMHQSTAGARRMNRAPARRQATPNGSKALLHILCCISYVAYPMLHILCCVSYVAYPGQSGYAMRHQAQRVAAAAAPARRPRPRCRRTDPPGREPDAPGPASGRQTVTGPPQNLPPQAGPASGRSRRACRHRPPGSRCGRIRG